MGGLLVAILGGLFWKRGTGFGAAASMVAGTVATLSTMIYLEITGDAPYDGVYANEPIYFGLIASAAVYLVVSLLTPRTDPAVMSAWEDRVAGRAQQDAADTEMSADASRA